MGSLYPVLKIMPLQQLASELALWRGEDPDAAGAEQGNRDLVGQSSHLEDV